LGVQRTGYIHGSSLENWEPIPTAKQDSRAVIQATNDAYFKKFDDINVTVPCGTPCARLEGGACTGANNLTGETCDLGLPSTIKVTNRRYVVDEDMGAVDIFLGFLELDRSRADADAGQSFFQGGRGARLGISILFLVWGLVVGWMGFLITTKENSLIFKQ
jgi:hypothetical protein